MPYIEFDAAKKALEAIPPGNWNAQRYISALESLKAADVVERRTGHWIERYVEDGGPFSKRRFYCSNCGRWNTYGKTPGCPYCMAEMFEITERRMITK